MKNHLIKQILLWILLINFCIIGADEVTPAVTDSDLLLNLTHNSKSNESDTTLFFNYFFSKKCQNYFYAINQHEKTITISFVNIRLGGFLVDDTVLQIDNGPIESIQLKEHIEDKNKEVKGLNPEFYYVTNATLKCSRVPLSEGVLKFSEKDDMITMSLPWPAGPLSRDSLYSSPPKQKRKGLIIALAGIGAAGLAGGGMLLFTLLSGKEDPDVLPVNLPVHPATP